MTRSSVCLSVPSWALIESHNQASIRAFQKAEAQGATVRIVFDGLTGVWTGGEPPLPTVAMAAKR